MKSCHGEGEELVSMTKYARIKKIARRHLIMGSPKIPIK